jgi:hypothetical protein
MVTFLESAALAVMMVWVLVDAVLKIVRAFQKPATAAAPTVKQSQPVPKQEEEPLTPEEDYQEYVQVFVGQYGRQPTLEEDNKLRAHVGLPLRSNGHSDEPVPPVVQKVEAGAVATAAPKPKAKLVHRRKKKESAA